MDALPEPPLTADRATRRRDRAADRPTGQGGEELSDEQLLAEELALLDPTRPSDHQRAGGAPASFAALVLALALIGLFASVQLVLAELDYARDPGAALSCDINPVIGCGGSIAAWQGHLLFGIPNALLGAGAFGGLAGIAVAFLAGARVARWMWRLLSVAVLGGFAFVAFFVQQSLTAIGTLCPYCMVTWAAVIPLTFAVLGRAAQAGHLPVPAAWARFLLAQRWTLTAVSYGIVLVLATVVFWDEWRLVLGY